MLCILFQKMKKTKRLIEKIAEPDNLRLAFWKAQKGKSYKSSVVQYRENLNHNLLELREQILAGQVKTGEYHYFKIYDPKEREICASAFDERVLHHALMNICHEYFDKFQIYDSYASRPGKGVHVGLKRAKKYTEKYQWFLKLDVRKYFASIEHQILQRQLEKRFSDRKLLYIFEQIISSYYSMPGKGLPIGNLASQYFANHYLGELDHFIKESLRCKAYVRYMDDMVIWHDDKSQLKELRDIVNEYVSSRLNCTLKPALLNKTTRGLSFCGYILHPNHIRLTQRSKKRYLRKMNDVQEQYNTGNWTEEKCQRHALPLIAFTRHADALGLRQAVLKELELKSGSDKL